MKITKWVILAVLSASTVMSFSLMACNDNKEQDQDGEGNNGNTEVPADGPEAGVYYYETSGNEFLITLNGGDRFSLSINGESMAGEYTLADGTLTFNFEGVDETATATLDGNVLTLSYDGSVWRFLKKVQYTVSFDEAGGEDVADVTVVNGQTVARPADPVREGYVFLGWRSSEDAEAFFDFSTEVITSNITLHAVWAELVPGQREYVVDFDLGEDYEGTEPDSMTTIGGRLYGLPDVSRENYTFDGWWVSMYDDGEKLSYPYSEDMVFEEDTTLFAAWHENSATAPVKLYADETGVHWSGLTSAATLTITGPEGFEKIETSLGSTGNPSYAIDFASQPAGDYTVSLTYAGNTVNAYYKNKALSRVSRFTVVDPSMLVFEGVEGAERYYLTVECGNEEHVHEYVDLGTSTSYNFANCPMTEDGISFTVTAVADGYASSVSRTYVYNRMLGAVTGLYVDEETQTLVWNTVKGASDYVVTVNGQSFDNGGKTSFSLKTFDAGELAISVVAKTKGYNSPDPSAITYTKANIAAPSNVRIADQTLVWDAVEGATSYQIKIGGQIIDVASAATSYDLSTADIDWTQAADYSISVKAVGATESLFSDVLDARYLALYNTLTYEHNTLSWRPVIGADSYTVRINGAREQTITGGLTSVELQLTKGGYNTLSVCFTDGTTTSEWVELEVYAYTVTFDPRGGAAASPVYVAMGDMLTLPSTERLGYDFAGWYNTPGGAAANGALCENGEFSNDGDVTLFAYWTPKTYTITLDYGDYGTGATTAEVTYTEGFKLPVPQLVEATLDSGTKIFMGWYSTPDANGTRYTNENGESLIDWPRTDENVTIYAVYIDAVEFVVDGDGYSVKAGTSIGRITDLVIPSHYNGKKVVSIAEYGFKSCYSLVSVTIPDTVKTIASTAFDGCSKLDMFYVQSTGEADPVYSTTEGTLLYKNPITGALEIAFVPRTRTGVYTIPEGVTRINQNTFNKSKLTEIIIPATVTSISAQAFNGLTELKTLTFLDGGEDPLDMNDTAIYNCSHITVLNLPARLQAFDKSVSVVFKDLDELTAINIIGTYEGAAYGSFDGVLTNGSKDTILYCPIGKTGKLDVPSYVTAVAEYAFCSDPERTSWSAGSIAYNGITEVTFTSSLNSIGARAFYYCKNLTKVTFTAGATYSELVIGEYAFYNCTKLATVDFQETGSLGTTVVDGVTHYVYNPTTSCGVTQIGAHAFEDCKIEKLLLPSTLTNIGESAFDSVSALKEIDFSHVSSDLVFGDYAFARCTGLTEIEFTDNVGIIDFNSVFYRCTGIDSFVVSPNNPNYSTDADGVLYDREKTTIVFYPEGLTGNYVIPDTVTSIGGGVFYDKSNITSITIPAGITSIGVGAFELCTNLKEVIFEEGTSPLTIGGRAFYDCRSLTSIKLPARTQSIGEYCFGFSSSNTSKLSDIKLNEGLEEIGDNAFYRNTALTTLTIPSTVTYIGRNAFSYSGLTTITFAETPAGTAPAELTMGYGVFSGLMITSIVLPERLAYIPESAFSYCDILTSVTIPTTVRDSEDGRAIREDAFSNCKSLEQLIFTPGGTQPLSIAATALSSCEKLTSLTLPARASGYKNNYDVFEMLDSATLVNAHNMGTPFYNSTTSSSESGITTPITSISVASEQGVTGKFWAEDGILYYEDVLVFCPMNKEGVVTIPKEVVTIRPSAFYNCSKITKIVFEDSSDVNGKDFYFADAAVSSSGSSTTVGIQYSEIAFYGCDALKSIELPARLTRIGSNALRIYDSLNRECGFDSITFDPNCRLTEIGEYAFYGAKISSIVLPANVATVGEKIFGDCGSLRTITLSKKMTVEGLANIMDSVTFEDIIVPEGSEGLHDVNGIIFSGDEKTLAYCPADFAAESYTIPGTVTSIPDSAFENVVGLKEVIFAEGTEDLAIGNEAFRGSGITKIQLPARLKSLGTYAFADCDNLISVTFEEGYSYSAIPNGAFNACANLTSIAIPASVTNIGLSAFYNCTGLQTITFGDAEHVSQLTEIGNSVFSGCTSLTSVTFPASLQEFGSATVSSSGSITSTTIFKNCTSLTSVTFLGNGVEIIGGSSFDGCTALTSVNLEALTNLTAVGSYAFRNCSSLTSATLGEKVATLGTYTFQNCSSLTSVTMNGTADIPQYCFDGCTKLATVTLNDNIEGIGNYAFRKCSSLVNIKLPSALVNLGTPSSYSTIPSSYVFQDCTSLKSIVIPSGVKDIYKYTFDGCTSLESVDLGNVEAIYSYAFNDCKALKSIELPETLINIGYNKALTGSETSLSSSYLGTSTSYQSYVFAGTSLESVTIPASVMAIGPRTFYNLSTLKEVVFKTNESGDNALLGIGAYAFSGTAISSVTIALNTATVGANAFENCTSLTSVVWNSDANISDNTFKGCSKLSSVTINGDVERIGKFSFAGCAALSSLTLPDSLVAIGNTSTSFSYSTDANTFEGCTSLTSITLPAGITLGPNVFAGCTGLTSVNFTGGVASATDGSVAVTMPTFWQGAFSGCTKIASSATTPQNGIATFVYDGVMYLDVYVNSERTQRVAVSYVGNSDTVEFAEGVTAIGQYAFSCNETLTAVTIPAGLDSIGMGAFSNCTKIKTVDFAPSTDPNYKLALPTNSGGSANYGMFGGCTALTTVTIPEYVVDMGRDTFRDCDALTTVYFNATECADVEKNSYNIFYKAGSEADGLTVYIGANVKRIPAYLFRGSSSSYAPNLVSVVFAENSVCEEIGLNAFEYCDTLTSFTVPASMKTIADEAFADCFHLTQVTNLSTLAIVAGSDTFGGIALYAPAVSNGTDNMFTTTEDGFTFAESAEGTYLISYSGDATELTLPANFNGKSYAIGSYVFYDNLALTSVVIPEGVTAIGNYAFDGCTALTSVVISSTVKSIGDYAFNDCSKMATITLSEGLESIGAYAFADCDKVTEMVIPSTVTYVGMAAFNSMGAVTKIEFLSSADPERTITFADGTSTSSAMFYSCSNLVTLILPDNMTAVPDYFIYSASKLTSLNIPDSVTSIGTYAVYSCTKLTSITIPAGVKSVGNRAFNGCTAVEEIYYNAVNCADMAASNYAFYNVGKSSSGGVTVYIGADVVRIPAWLFHPYSATSNLYVPNITKIVFLGNAVTSVGTNALLGVTTVEEIYFYGDQAALEELMVGIESGNESLLGATIYFYSETEPAKVTDGEGNTTYAGNFWHFDENGEVVVWVYVEPEEPEEGEETPSEDQSGDQTAEEDASENA